MELKQHLISRGMNPDLYNVQYDLDEGVVTFYLQNLTGQFTGYQQYRPGSINKKCNDPKQSRYFTYSREGLDCYFGLESLNFSKTLFLVEGIFKAAVLHRLGFSALAVLTNHPKRMKPFFRILRKTRNLVAIGDPDAAGQKLVNTIGAGFCSPKDLDEMSDSDLLNILSVYK